jgi:hypothetical protein
MKKSDQKSFKQSLISFDKLLDAQASRVEKEAEKKNWIEAAKAEFELTTSCISCHLVWKHKTK